MEISGGSGELREKVGTTNMFMGEYHHTIDIKGRMIVPSKFRDGLGETFVLTRTDQCLFGYPMSEWKIIEDKLKNLPLTKKMLVHLPVFSFQVRLNVSLINRVV